MKTLSVLLSVVLFYNKIVTASGVRGTRTERDELMQQGVGRVTSSQTQSVTLPPVAVDPIIFVGSEAPTPSLPSEIQASSHIIQWGSAQNGCSYALPPVTISCGAGGIISLGQKASTVKGCFARNSDTLVCSSVSTPTKNPQLTVTCSGTTTAQLAASVQISPSQATCNSLLGTFPQSKLIIRGGATSVLALLGRYCKTSNGALYLNTNYTCGSGDKTVTQGAIRICVADGSCTRQLTCNSSTPNQSCPGSCMNKLAAVTVSDQDTRDECINAGPRPSPLPASLHGLTWSSFHPRCSPSASTVTASCGNGGSLSVASSTSSQCTAVGIDSLLCTKNATTSSASVVFFCYGRTALARTASAFLPKSNATNCTLRTAATKVINVASQVLGLHRFCGNGTLTPRPSKACGKSSQLVFTKPNNNTVCISSNQCNSTSNSSCSISLDAISVSDPSTDPICTLLGPKSLNF